MKKFGAIVVGAAGVLVLAVFIFRRPAVTSPSLPEGKYVDGRRISPEVAAEFAHLEAREAQANESVWAAEMKAEDAGRLVEDLWNRINASSNRLMVLTQLDARDVRLGTWTNAIPGPHGITLAPSSGPGAVLHGPDWDAFVRRFEAEGWRLGPVEFRHLRFETNELREAKASGYYVAADFTKASSEQRATIEGMIEVRWTNTADGVRIDRVDGSNLTVRRRMEASPFQLVLNESIDPLENSQTIDPLIVYDLDQDGIPEIILAARNLVFRRNRQGGYGRESLCRYPPGPIFPASIADFNGDGAPDYLCCKIDRFLLYGGSPLGTFDHEPAVAWKPSGELGYPMVLSCGDIDGDGDLDLFLGQYKDPFAEGSSPTPFYDANDGFPAFLLVNDGRGNFRDATTEAGLGKKRGRRTYSASFADLDGDGDLDLIVVSDFAGVDLYENDGRGRFSDVTARWVSQPHAFGMAHALNDFNRDGRIDLLVMGMPSPAVDRLQHLGLRRDESLSAFAMRQLMTRGNLLYLGGSGGFHETELAESIRRSGWSWGCGVFDFDNDSFPDVYVANGLESNASVQDYESEYWLHDRFVAQSEPSPSAFLYLKAKFARTRARDFSYGGYERNRLYLNLAGRSFLEAAHLLGVSLQEDSRNVVAADLNLDGREDLVVTTREIWPAPKQTLRVYENRLGDAGHWIGFRFRESPAASPVGASVRIHCGGWQSVREMVTGDSYRSQHPLAVHFGLGADRRIDAVEIVWPTGRRLELKELAADRYYEITVPEK